ncbi:MAG: glycoside hydrolase family 43 protein [Bacilli bacterium]|nr:glycoside hydrolase family 43 protein [Bacilli bacterium]
MEKIVRTNITGLGDPQIVLENNIYYLFATGMNQDDSYAFSYCYSDNLSDFKYGGPILLKKDSFGVSEFWAPEIHKINGIYYLVYSARDTKGIMHVQIASSLKLTGPYKDLKETPLLEDDKFSTIDGHLFEDNGRIYLFYSLDCSTNIINGVHTSQIYAVELSKDLKSVISKPTFISTPDHEYEYFSGPEWRWNEGPYVLKHNNKYYLTYSTNCYCDKHYAVGCAVSDNILGPYKKYDDVILSYIDNEISGPGHNSFFIDKDGSLKICYHIHTFIDNPSGNRRACTSRAYFDKDDKLVIDYK